MNRLIRYWNQNRFKIIIIIIIIVFAILLIRFIDYIVSIMPEENNIAQNNLTNYVGPTESVLTGEEMTKNQMQMVSTIYQFVDYCNAQNIEEAYNLLSQECKEELYTNIDIFTNNYVTPIFNNQNKIAAIENWGGNTYKVQIKDNPLTTGINNTQDVFEDYITIVIDDNGENKLNINNYIGREEINKVGSIENIEITVLRSDTYMDYQTYTFKVVNNSTNEILLDDKVNMDSLYIVDQNNLKLSAYTHEISTEELRIMPRETREITIKYYNNYIYGDYIQSINFSRIILNYNKNEIINYGTVKIEL